MDSNLYKAAATGNIDLLKEALPSLNTARIDDQFISSEGKDNIIHLAAKNGHQDFIFEVIEKIQLPISLKRALICHKNRVKWNPLHRAAWEGHFQIVRILIESYHKLSSEPEIRLRVEDAQLDDNNQIQPPWLATTTNRSTPLNLAMQNGHEEVALYILSQDLEKFCNMVDSRKSPLYQAVTKGMERVALQILTSDCSYSLGSRDLTLLHDSYRITEFKNLFCHKNIIRGDNPLHCAAAIRGNVEVVKLLMDACLQLFVSNGEQPDNLPWLHGNSKGQTPLYVALDYDKEDVATYLLDADFRLAFISDSDGKGPLFLAVERRLDEAVGHMVGLRTLLSESASPLYGLKRQSIFHIISEWPGPFEILIDFPYDKNLMNMEDINGKKPLDYAAAKGNVDLISWILKSFDMRNNAPYAWIEACKSGHMDAFLVLMNSCYDFGKLCVEQKNTPLHHMRLQTREQYQTLLDIPLIGQLKNLRDSDDATPLHRAIERADIVFVELLLGAPDIDWDTKDKNGETAMNLLAKRRDELPDWVSIKSSTMNFCMYRFDEL
ncbi:uncharacterized protein LOC104907152 [Beta vulgaris subsp. vulgaris]|uniref:uncharacterized protein LOC104907152 n=1 Tax=Beta vulgaris subsp. vulgaris TaxID=3555 RepID=UPI002547EA0C|nr:uncharacterized protein LOC104907152 [Beta vulgaris subsp. vulgaris]